MDFATGVESSSRSGEEESSRSGEDMLDDGAPIPGKIGRGRDREDGGDGEETAGWDIRWKTRGIRRSRREGRMCGQLGGHHDVVEVRFDSVG